MEKIYSCGYWNTNNIATAVVAVATYFDDELFDWAAYIGGTTKTEHEQDAYDEVAKYGAKLPRATAVHFVRSQGWSLSPELYRE